MKKLLPTILIAALAALCLPLGGCQTTDNVISKIKGEDAVVVKIPYDEDEVEVKVRPSLNQNCVDGVRHLKNEDWAAAKAELEQAVAKRENDHQAHFALGVACEKLNDLACAFEHYKAANFHGPGTDVQYNAARLRAEDKLKSAAAK